MKKYLDAAKRHLRTDVKTVFFFGDGADARLMSSQGPWSKIKKNAGNAIIILPPFAEEMNRCRRLMKLTQDSLAAKGLCSLSVDYYGTGDSAGDFKSARLSMWESDVLNACALAKHAGAATVSLLGFRFGALMAAAVAHKISDVKHIYAVAPQESFKRAIRQFVRIASSLPDAVHDGGTGMRAPGAAKRLDNGETVQIGGYELSPNLYADFMAKQSDTKSTAEITALFVSSPTTQAAGLSAAEKRQLLGLSAHSESLSYTTVNDAQMWYQGVPDEPINLPTDVADVICGGPVQDFNAGD